MGTLRVVVGADARQLPLSASTRLGRHWSCDLVVPGASVPLHWLEVRWRDDHWSWRPLGATERTRGTGTPEPADFRGWSINGRVLLDGCEHAVEVTLVDVAAPTVFVEDLQSRRRWHGAELERAIEIWADGRCWPLGADPCTDPPLTDGAVFVLDGRALRLHKPFDRLETDNGALYVGDPEIALSIEPATLRATLETGSRRAIVVGEAVRLLWVYARARLVDTDGGGDGWMPAQAAFAEWVEAGGKRTSRVDRLAWERSRLRSRLAAQGVVGLERLFETRGAGPTSEVRLALAPPRIAIGR